MVNSEMPVLKFVAWLLDLKERSLPFTPMFHAYLFVGLKEAILFTDAEEGPGVKLYLESVGVVIQRYNDLWAHLRARRRLGKAGYNSAALSAKEITYLQTLITPLTSQAVALMLTPFEYIIDDNFLIERQRAIKSLDEVTAIKEAYLQDSTAAVRLLAWLTEKIKDGYDIMEHEASARLVQLREERANYICLSCDALTASGPIGQYR